MTACAIIVSYRTGDVLGACLGGLLAADGLDEIIIVDNGNAQDGEALLDAAARGDSRVRIVRGHGNIGFAAACNLGARMAHSEVLVFVNPDVILKPAAINDLVAALAAAPPPAIVGGDLRDKNGNPDRGSRRDRLTLWRAFVSFSGLARLGVRDHNLHADPLPSAPTDVSAISGALFVIRQIDFEHLCGFDEGYFLHVEDIDLCRRAEDLGWRVLFAPGPHGVHLRSTSDADSREIARLKAEGIARYFNKFATGSFDRVLAQVASMVLLALRPSRERKRLRR